jgi:hypothetical protein
MRTGHRLRAGKVILAPRPEDETLCRITQCDTNVDSISPARPDFFWLIATLTPGIVMPVNCSNVLCVQQTVSSACKYRSLVTGQLIASG